MARASIHIPMAMPRGLTRRDRQGTRLSRARKRCRPVIPICLSGLTEGLEEAAYPAFSLGNSLSEGPWDLLDEWLGNHAQTPAVGPQAHADLRILDSQPWMKAAKGVQIRRPEEESLAQHIERMLTVSRHMCVHRCVPAHVIKGME